MNTAFLLFALHLPERRMFNEFYAKDTSRKIRAVFKAKGQSGKPLSTNPPYGYVKDPEDKTHWLVDEKAAEVVREIFRLCIQGYGVCGKDAELVWQEVNTILPKEHGFLYLGSTPAPMCMDWTEQISGR